VQLFSYAWVLKFFVNPCTFKLYCAEYYLHILNILFGSISLQRDCWVKLWKISLTEYFLTGFGNTPASCSFKCLCCDNIDHYQLKCYLEDGNFIINLHDHDDSNNNILSLITSLFYYLKFLFCVHIFLYSMFIFYWVTVFFILICMNCYMTTL
jgi:hypothetical protein